MWQVDPALQAVICTAHSDYSWREIVDKLGLTDSLLILKKPFDVAEVLQAAHTLTRKWVAQRQAQLKLAEMESIVEARTQEIERINQEALSLPTSPRPLPPCVAGTAVLLASREQ